MKFSMTHLYLKGEPELFTELDPPTWLVSPGHEWWYNDYVLTLAIGESIKSDFREITRVE